MTTGKTWEDQGDTSPAQVYGKYQLLELLARGGMAEVFKAKSHGVEGFEKILVIKRILPELSVNPQFVEMFINEAKIAVTLSHANIVHVFDLGRADDTYYIAMEYVAGTDLAALAKACVKAGERIPQPIAIFIVSEVAKALDYAHRRRDDERRPLNIVHRDVSPHNILASFDGEVKLTDFGIAKAATTVQEEGGVLKGKYAYMAPEQARGHEVDARMDIFSLGTVLYELLSGANPFVDHSQYEVLKRIREGTVPPLASYVEEVSEELSEIVAKAMAPEPDERYQDAGRFYQELIGYLFSTGVRVGGHDVAEFVESMRARNVLRTGQGATGSVLRAAFATDSDVGDVDESDLTPVEVPDYARASQTSPSLGSLQRPEHAWREVTVLAALLPSADSLSSSTVDGLLRRCGGESLSMSEAPESQPEWWFAIFGSDQIDGRDSENAVRCAWRLRRHFLGRGTSAEEEGVRIAVVSGRALFSSEGELSREGEFHDMAETARSLSLLAEPQSILVSGSVERSLRDRFGFAQQDLVGVSNVFSVESELAASESFGHFVGRREELRRLGELLAIANAGRVRTIVIEGVAGFGKTRLVMEIARRLGVGGHNVGMYVTQLSSRLRGVSLSAISEMLRVILGVDEFDSESVARSKVERLRELGLGDGEIRAVATAIGLPGGSENARERLLFRSVGRIVTRLAADRLSVFVFDGVESMDEASAEMLLGLAEMSRQHRIALILTSRPGAGYAWHDSSGYECITLDPLEDDDVARLTGARLDADEVPAALLQAVTIKSGGNPLYIEELLKALQDAGAVQTSEGKVQYDAEVAEVRVPKTLRGIIGARVGRLEATERYLLQVLSVLRRTSSGSLIVRIAGETMERGGKALRSLEEQGFLSREGRTDFRFTHALMADVIRDGLPRESLRAMHLGVAQALEALYPAMIAEMAERLAHHYRGAGERVAAVRYLELAARRCTDENAYDQGIRNLEDAIALIRSAPQPDNAHLLEVYQRATMLCLRASKPSKGLALAESAFELSEALEKQDCIARFSIIQAQLLGAENRFREAEPWMQRGISLAASLGDLAMRREGTVALSELYSRNGEYRRAAHTLTEALEMVLQAHDRDAEFTCRLHLAVAYAGGRQEELCLAQLEVAAELVRGSDDPLQLVALYKNETVVGHFLEDEERTLRVGEVGLKLAKEYHLVHDQAAIAHNMGEAYLGLKDFKRGFSHLKFSHDLAVEHGLRRLEYINLRLLGYIDVVRFHSTTGREKVLEALGYAKRKGLVWDYLQCMHTMGQVEQALGDITEARRYFREVIRLSGEHGNRQYEREARTALESLPDS